jgi:hypothetical protein
MSLQPCAHRTRSETLTDMTARPYALPVVLLGARRASSEAHDHQDPCAEIARGGGGPA